MLERPAAPDDVPALVELWRRFETATSGAAETDEAAVRGDWQVPGFDFQGCTRVLEDGGRIVGHALLLEDHDADSVVDPLRAGERLEDRLLSWLEGAGRPLQHFWGAHDQDAVERFARRGWVVGRTAWRMRIELGAPTPAPVWPDGVTVRGMDPEGDRVVVHGIVQTAFEDVGDGHVRKDLDTWAAQMLAPDRFDADLYVVAEQAGEVVGACLAQRTEGFAFVRQLAVPRAHRGRGLARALLLESFRRHADHGLPATVLGVDAANATGATRLYESVGMRVVEEFTRWDWSTPAP